MTGKSPAAHSERRWRRREAIDHTGRYAVKGRLVEVGETVAETTLELVDGDEAAPKKTSQQGPPSHLGSGLTSTPYTCRTR